MFLRGADQQAAEFRLPSLRGALRFWFRAMAGLAFDGDEARIDQEEADLFGSAAGAKGPAPSSLRFRPGPVRKAPPNAAWAGPDGIRYLIGPSITDLPAHLAPGRAGSFSVRGRSADDLQRVGVCLAALSRYGGLGARVRRGFGAIRFGGLNALCPGIEAIMAAETAPMGLFDTFCGLYDVPPRSPSATAISPKPSFSAWQRKVSAHQPWTTWSAALDEVGKAFDRYRSPIDRNAEDAQQFNQYDPRRYMSREYRHIIDPEKYGNRREQNPVFPLGAFGLPIQFAHGRTVTLWEGARELRRASPLWIRPVRAGDRQWQVIYHVFRSDLWPDSAGLKLSPGGHRLRLDSETAYSKLADWLEKAP